MRHGALLLLATLIAPAALRAQQPEQEPDSIPIFAGGYVLMAAPVGEFGDNVGSGWGLGLHGRFPVTENGALSLRLDLGFINYGNETIRICITQPCRVTGELSTSNNIFLFGAGPEVGVGSGAARLYANASIGLAYFATTSSVEGEGNLGDPFASSTNFDDLTFAWTAGPGAQLRMWSGGSTSGFLDLFARYQGNGEARYLRKGDIHDQSDGSVTLTPRQSKTNFWTVGIGISIGFTAEG